MTSEPRFICRLQLTSAFAATSTTPPDSDFLATVVRGQDLRDFKITGLDTDFLTIEATGSTATSRLEHSFRRHFTWGCVISGTNHATRAGE